VRFELKMARTYFRAKRKSLARFTAIAAIVGITAGVAALILAQALARGFQSEMRDKILSNTAHITVFRKDGLPVSDYQQFITDLGKIENVRAVSPTTYESAILLGTKANSYAVLRVVESRESRLESAEPGIEGWIEVKLGAELAEKAGLRIGETAEILIADGETAKNSTVRITDTFQTGIFEYDSSWIYLSPGAHARLFNRQRFHPTVLSVSVTDIYRAEETAGRIRQNLSEDFRIVDWQEANKPLFAALSLEKKVSLAIISLIIFIAVLNITTTLALLVGERKLDIAILRTCGARRRSILLIFLFEGLGLAVGGIIFGVISGLALAFAGNYFRLVRLEAKVYSLEYIPLDPALSDLLLIIAVTCLLSTLATLYPAWRAAGIKPLENLRTS
jgi:lipoprotein-releasing system permease protein